MSCSVEGCLVAARAKGLCQTHYKRLTRTGDLMANRPIGRGRGLNFIMEISGSSETGCIDWPFALNGKGYGQLTVDYQNRLAHRESCRIAHGEPPSDEHQAAHNCGNSNCVNPNHVRWATPRENTHDKFSHGTMAFGEGVSGAKLTNIQAAKAFRDQRPVAEIARELPVSKDAIWKLKRGVTFARVTSNLEMYTDALGMEGV